MDLVDRSYLLGSCLHQSWGPGAGEGTVGIFTKLRTSLTSRTSRYDPGRVTCTRQQLKVSKLLIFTAGLQHWISTNSDGMFIIFKYRKLSSNISSQ